VGKLPATGENDQLLAGKENYHGWIFSGNDLEMRNDRRTDRGVECDCEIGIFIAKKSAKEK